ncbi:hypothetical protein UFOVP431_103 [uncultured Caudovirales phage]|uniref:Uncharacterized protein n=1 Tax=uncultured Caudovirales phage TaxID=2100421 RepID=A0A6J5MNY4_9CAUD|nr:hypothetical protein UFOVP431_103 [uncultured Caudovirales phage]
MIRQPDWFQQVQRDLEIAILVPNGAVIDWNKCRDRFLIPLLKRLESRTDNPNLPTVRMLLERRLAGEGVAWEIPDDSIPPYWPAGYAAAGRVWSDRDLAPECAAQVADLKAAIATSIQPPSADQLLPPDEVEVILSGPGIWSVCRDPSGVLLTQQLAPAEEAVRLLRADPAPPAPQPPAPTLNELETNFRDWFKERHLQPYYGGIALIDATQWGQHLIQQFSPFPQLPALGNVGELIQRLRIRGASLSAEGANLHQRGDAFYFNSAADLLLQQAATIANLTVAAPTPAAASVGILHISDFRGLENADFMQTAELPAGRYELFTTPTPRVMVPPVPVARPFNEWLEDYGPVLCWRFPIEEPPHVGCPLDSDWGNYYTHWTPLVCPADPTKPAQVQP